MALKREAYLESRTLTAPSYRLHLMLVEGAIRIGRQAAEALRRGDEVAAAGPLMRMVEIVGELLAGVREQQSPLNRRIAGVYMFLFRTVSLAKINNDAAKLAEALELLEFERETWQMVCDKLGGEAERNRVLPNESPATASTPSALSLEA